MKALEIVDLTKYYGEVRGVEKLNLSVETGEFFLGLLDQMVLENRPRLELFLGLLKQPRELHRFWEWII